MSYRIIPKINESYLHRTNDKGQWIYYSKVGGCLITGNEDGGKASSKSILYMLQHIGVTIPPNVDSYWVGEAGPGPSYIEAGQSNDGQSETPEL